MSIDVSTLIEHLSRPEAYPHPVDAVEVHQTHISVVFLAGPFAYKIKKPVNLGFLDFSTLEKRKHFCEEEVRLNRRMAPNVYLGVVAIVSEPEASAKVRVNSFADASGSAVVEWAVQMKRLPAEATLEQRLARGDVLVEQIRALAERIAEFHRCADANERIAAFGHFEIVARNARENFEQSERLVGTTVSRVVFDRLRALTESALHRHAPLIDDRARLGVPRDSHGDLHLDHVYCFPDQAPPEDLVVVDCIEFSERYRFADPVADMAFLAMDLAFHGRRDLVQAFIDAYFTASGDADGRALVPFYSAYRAMVRAKVEGIALGEAEIAAEDRWQAETRARAHWLLALGELAVPGDRPAIVLLAGLPGSGKSTIARALAESGSFRLLRSDVVRKELAGDASLEQPEFNQGIYAEAWTERTYGELLRRVEPILWEGGRVIIDANLRTNERRRPFFEAARRWAVPIVFIHCQASRAATRARLKARRGDASDADWRVYEQLAQTWESLLAAWLPRGHRVDTSGSLSENEVKVQAILTREGLG